MGGMAGKNETGKIKPYRHQPIWEWSQLATLGLRTFKNEAIAMTSLNDNLNFSSNCRHYPVADSHKSPYLVRWQAWLGPLVASFPDPLGSWWSLALS